MVEEKVRNQSIIEDKKSVDVEMSAQNTSQNVNLNVPINFKIEPNNNTNKEAQQTSMK